MREREREERKGGLGGSYLHSLPRIRHPSLSLLLITASNEKKRLTSFLNRKATTESRYIHVYVSAGMMEKKERRPNGKTRR